MDSRKVLYSSGGNDECYTPRYAVLPLLKYIDKSKIIWCPFDEDDSEFVKVFREAGYTVVNTHIRMGQDFLNYTPDFKWDVIISNPPFTNKKAFFERALEFNKPFALLMSNTWLNDSTPKKLFGNDLELLMFWERIKFSGLAGDNNKITFSSSYFCKDFLPDGKQIICESLKAYMEI